MSKVDSMLCIIEVDGEKRVGYRCLYYYAGPKATLKYLRAHKNRVIVEIEKELLF